jgi:hypothetical protein
MWPEDLGNGESEWRGKAQDIATGDSGYFRDWPGLIAVIQRALEQPLPLRPPQEAQAQSEESEQIQIDS